MATERGKIKTSIGGQALIEGVMMRGPRKTVATVRKPDGSLESKEFSCEFGWRKYPVLRIPLIRGVAGFIESMAIGYKTLMYSAEAWEKTRRRSRSPGLKNGWIKRLAIN